MWPGFMANRLEFDPSEHPERLGRGRAGCPGLQDVACHVHLVLPLSCCLGAMISQRGICAESKLHLVDGPGTDDCV